jgi:hypothetical protein
LIQSPRVPGAAEDAGLLDGLEDDERHVGTGVPAAVVT